MIRIVLFMIATLLVGIVVGISVLSPAQNTKPVRQAPNETLDLDAIYQDSIIAKNTEIDALSEKNATLSAQIRALRQEINSVDNTDAELALDLISDTSNSEIEAVPQEENASKGRRRDQNDEESQRRRAEFANQIRDRMLNVWDQEWEKATPESKERITTISNYQQDLIDIRGEIRQAETDEDRAVLLEEMNSTRDSLKQTLNEERTAQLSSLAEQYGIKNEADVNRFIKDTQKTLRSPVFQVDPNRGGGFGGSSGGGRNRPPR